MPKSGKVTPYYDALSICHWLRRGEEAADGHNPRWSYAPNLATPIRQVRNFSTFVLGRARNFNRPPKINGRDWLEIAIITKFSTRRIARLCAKKPIFCRNVQYLVLLSLMQSKVETLPKNLLQSWFLRAATSAAALAASSAITSRFDIYRWQAANERTLHKLSRNGQLLGRICQRAFIWALLYGGPQYRYRQCRLRYALILVVH